MGTEIAKILRLAVMSLALCAFTIGSNAFALDFEEGALELAKGLSVSALEPSMPDTPFEKWFHEAAGEGSSISWELTDCGEQTGDPALDKGRDFPACVEAIATLPDASRVAVSINVGTFGKGIAGKPSLSFIVIIRDGVFVDIGRLAEIERALGAGKRK